MIEPYTHAGGVVLRRLQNHTLFLLVTAKNQSDEWVLPKGHIEQNETPEKAAVREVEEESGVRASIVERIDESTYSAKEQTVRVIFYLMRYVGENRGTEGRRTVWLGLEEGLGRLSFEDSRRIVREAYAMEAER